MALIRTSTLISDIRGSVGGVVFQNNGAGLIVRNKTSGKNRETKAQILQRNVIYYVQQQWSFLSDIQQAGFNSLVKLAQVKQSNIIGRLINGQQLFVKVNSLLSRYGVSIIENTYLRSLNVENFTIEIERGEEGLIVNMNRELIIIDELLVLKMSRVINGSVNNDSGSLKMIVFEQVDVNGWNITSEVVEVFGVMPGIGDMIFVEYFIVGKRTALISSKRKEKLIIV